MKEVEIEAGTTNKTYEVDICVNSMAFDLECWYNFIRQSQCLETTFRNFDAFSITFAENIAENVLRTMCYVQCAWNHKSPEALVNLCLYKFNHLLLIYFT